MSELKGRALMESRYGPLWSGGQVITVDGTEYDLDALTYHMGLNFEDSRAIDVSEVSAGRYVIRYYDGDDQRVVAYEFDSGFRFLGEIRAHIAEWIGDEAYFEWFKTVRIKCPADL